MAEQSLKILFWAGGFWPSIGGMETHAFQFVKAQQARGHSFFVIAQKDVPSQKDEEVHQGVSIKRFDFHGVIANRGNDTLGSLKNYIDRVLNTFRPDIVHLDTCIGASAVVFSMLKSMFSVPLLLTLHSPHYGKKVFQSVKPLCSYARQICCVSKWVIREMETLFPEFKDKVRLIYNGLPPFQVEPTPLSFSPPTLLIMGRFSIEKGFPDAIEAFALLKKKNSFIKFLIVGDGMERSSIIHLVNEFGLTGSVEFTGAIEREKIPHMINRSSLVVVPSHFEPFGLVALEAMQMGRPVVASNVGGLPEIVSDGEFGSLVAPKDSHALYEALQDLVDHPEKAIRMGSNARAFAMEHFTSHQNTLQYEAVYKELL